MWLRPPGNKTIADDIRDAKQIADLQREGWTEVKPLYIQHAETGVVHFVDHPEHQRRLLLDGGTPVAAPEEAPAEPEALPRKGAK